MSDIVIDGEVFDSETGELINKVEEIEVAVEKNELPEIYFKGGTHIQVNIKQLENSLVEYMDNFNIEVTEENEKQARKKTSELNKIALDLNKARIAVAKEIKKPADDLKKAVDGLIEIVQSKREDLLKKVSIFKEKRMDELRTLLKVELEKLYHKYSIQDEFKTVDIEEFVREDSLGKTNLSKKAQEFLNARVVKCKMTQDNVKIRLLELPLSCGGMKIPLTGEDIKDIIKLDEADYNLALQKKVDERLELEFKLEQQREAEEERKLKQEEERIEKQKAKEVEIGVKTVRIRAVFAVEVKSDVGDLKVLQKYQAEIASKFSTLKSISIE